MDERIHPETSIGQVWLTVSDLDRALGFYDRVLGLRLHRREGVTAHLGAGGPDLLALTELPGATKPQGTSGLYHFALLVPSRLELAQSLRRIAETRIPVQGMVNHWISEAIYLADPDGNGIEIARDWPKEQWPPLAGLFQRGNGPLDVDGVMAELEDAEPEWPGLNPATTIGHIHLHVGDVEAAERFYHGALGFEVTIRVGESVGFAAAGGYHHHIGYNTWAGMGAPPAPPETIGLRWFEVRLPDRSELERTQERVKRSGIQSEDQNGSVLLRDPSGNGVMLVA